MKKIAKLKIWISILIIFISLKSISQDSLKVKTGSHYAIIIIKKTGALQDETAAVYYDVTKTENLKNTLFKNYSIEIAFDPRRILQLFKYMNDQNYFLVSSNSINGNGSVSSYSYQYIFEKRDK